METTTRPFYSFVNGEHEYDPRDPVLEESSMDSIAWERFFYALTPDQLEVLLFLYLGYTPKEIMRKLRYKNIRRFYNVSATLRTVYRARKTVVSGI